MKTKAIFFSTSFAKKLGLVFLLIFALIISNSTEAKSQASDEKFLSQLPDTITIGIRTPVKSIGHQRESGSWSGFCDIFGSELETELKREGFDVETIFYPNPITNSYKGSKSPRYDGLKKEMIDIECGPNTILNDDELTLKGWEHIKFSQPFYTTGIKLLLKKGTLRFANIVDEDKIEQLKLKKIGVLSNTTTYNSLVKGDYRPIDFETRVELLTALENGNIEAFASDALILKNVLAEDYRNINSQEEYTLFPSQPNQYLPNTEKEDYGLAVLRGTDYEDILIKKINDTLLLDNLQKYINNLSLEESAKSIDNIIDESNLSFGRLESEKYELTQKLKKSFSRRTLFLLIPLVVILTLAAQKVLKFLL